MDVDQDHLPPPLSYWDTVPVRWAIPERLTNLLESATANVFAMKLDPTEKAHIITAAESVARLMCARDNTAEAHASLVRDTAADIFHPQLKVGVQGPKPSNTHVERIVFNSKRELMRAKISETRDTYNRHNEAIPQTFNTLLEKIEALAKKYQFLPDTLLINAAEEGFTREELIIAIRANAPMVSSTNNRIELFHSHLNKTLITFENKRLTQRENDAKKREKEEVAKEKRHAQIQERTEQRFNKGHADSLEKKVDMLADEVFAKNGGGRPNNPRAPPPAAKKPAKPPQQKPPTKSPSNRGSHKPRGGRGGGRGRGRGK